ncbi:translation initiation factor eIF 4e-like domain-containing protein [Trichoderma asperelloides]|nr:translation initiation factor eIF 4e-like domain-containing protein [Trichoderma asperelloides]
MMTLYVASTAQLFLTNVPLSSSSKLSLTTPSNGANGLGGGESGSRSATVKSSHGKSFNTTPGSGLVSPTGGASSAFGLGSGAFASFGSFGSAKTPKSGGNPFDSAMGSAVAKQAASKDAAKPVARPPNMAPISETKVSEPPAGATQIHMLKDAWSFWYRPPISKAHGFIEYENTLHGIATVRSAEEFWQIYSHLKRPSSLPVVSDYHLFKKDIRPIWEDEVNRKGGKWVVRLKKGVADRYWEDLLLSLVGDQFGDAGEDVCGAVLSMRNGEDILSIWTRTDGGRVLKIRETMKQVLNFPANTRLEFKSHDSSIQQRTAIDEQRREKASQHQGDKRHTNNSSKQSFE